MEAMRGMPGLRLTRVADAAAVLLVAGEVDVYEAPTFRNALFAIIDEGHDRLVVDCSGMTFIDSAGLAALVDARRRMGDGEIVLRAVRPASRRVFEITELASLFSFEQ